MKNITFEGISTLQRLHLCWQIRKQIGKIHQPIKVEFHQPICRKQCSSLWYGGLVVSIKVRWCVFAIHACGDIYATLYDKSDGTVLLMSLFQRKPVIDLTTMTTRFISRPSAII